MACKDIWRADRHGQGRASAPGRFRRHLTALLALYAVASLWHFAHNAEYIALYPHMPAWLTREKVYLAWLAVSAVGLLGAGFWLAGRRRAAGVAVAVYGLLGLGGLAHYSLALCSEHTLAMNFTIWLEALAGLALAASATWHLARPFQRAGSDP